jgi:uncharacterized membrane protein
MPFVYSPMDVMENPESPPAARRQHRLIRIIRARPRLFVCAAVGLVTIALLPWSWRLASRLLIGWDVGISLYLIAILRVMSHADMTRMRRTAALQDEGRFGILILTVAAALASLAAIFIELGTGPRGAGRDPVHIGLATLTLVLSWAFIHSIFALHYAHEFYSERKLRHGCLAFPGEEEPDYWDFVYFSFVIGMTSQVSDVTVTSRVIRRTVAAHGIVSFIFNATMMALTVFLSAVLI